ncbi:MAG: hypothetical protein AAF721_05700 [Myxococcota bacterium]
MGRSRLMGLALLVGCSTTEPSGADAGTDATVGAGTSTPDDGDDSGLPTTGDGENDGESGGAPSPTTAGTTGGSSGDDDATAGSDTGEPPQPAALEGYGTLSTFGEGGELCIVTNLDAQGPGSLYDCVTNRDTQDGNPTPRRIEFEVGGTIEQTQDIPIRQPYLTIDGLMAPEPGITIAKLGDGTDGALGITTWPPVGTCGHDVLVQGIRFVGVWTHDTEEHDQNAGTIGLDGEDLTLCVRNVVINRVTVLDAQDTGGDIWGSVTDVTVQYSAFLYSLHPNTYSHFPGGEADQQRERISNHHNVYAYIHERGPQVRGDIRDSNFEENIMHRWAAFGFGGGYAMRLRCRDGFCPQRLNVIGNHFTSGGPSLETALIVGDVSGNDADEAAIDGEVFMSGNRLPPQNVDETAAPAEFAREPEAEVTLFGPEGLVDQVLPNVGTHFRTAEEVGIFEEIGQQVTEDLGG